MREACLTALVFDDLARGKGTVKQLRAYQEIEWRRCEADPIYFLDAYGYIIDAGRVTRLRMWPIQRELVQTLHRIQGRANKTRESGGICGVKSRQLGVTTILALYDYWDILFHDARKWDLFSATEPKGKDIVDRVAATRDRIPRWMAERAHRRQRMAGEATPRGQKSESLFRVAYGLSEMKVATSTARNVQGASSNINFDEFTLHPEKERKLQQMFATIDGAAGVATVIANGDGEDEFFHFYQSCKRGDNGFAPFFFWWGDAPHRLKNATITRRYTTSKAVRKYRAEPVPGTDWWHFPTMTRGQVMQAAADGCLSAPWYDDMRRKFLMKNPDSDEFAFKAVYPTTEKEAFYISGNTRFGLDVVNGLVEKEHARRKRLGIPEDEAYPERCFIEKAGKRYIRNPNRLGKWRIYQEPRKDERYVVAIDPAGGKQVGDFGVIQVFRLVDDPEREYQTEAEVMGEQVAVFQAKIEPSDIAEEAFSVGEYYNEALVIPEANFHGTLVIDKMRDYPNLYMRRGHTDRFAEKETPDIGFWSSTQTKKRVVDRLAEWLNAGWLVLYDFPTLYELGHYEIRQTATGHTETGAPKGMTDDLVSGLYLAVEGLCDLKDSVRSSDICIILPPGLR